jgi:hypothetical protein
MAKKSVTGAKRLDQGGGQPALGHDRQPRSSRSTRRTGRPGQRRLAKAGIADRPKLM